MRTEMPVHTPRRGLVGRIAPIRTMLAALAALGLVVVASPAAQGQSCTFPPEGIPFGVEGFERTWPAAVFDDGSGPALHVVVASFEDGVTTGRLLRFGEGGWTEVGQLRQPGTADMPVYTMAVLDLGDGPALYLGGTFTSAGGVAARRVARYDGVGFSALGGGVDGRVVALEVYDDGSGPGLVAAGQFGEAGGVAADRVARWDGSAWSPLGPGAGGPGDGDVFDLVVFDNGTGPALYASGSFPERFGDDWIAARFDGSDWSFAGSQVDDARPTGRALAVHDDGTGASLFVGGNFNFGQNLARLEDGRWVDVAGRISRSVLDMVAADGPAGGLFIGGTFSGSPAPGVNHVVRWDGSAMRAMGQGLNDPVRQLLVGDLGDGPRVIALGEFSAEVLDGGVAAPGVALWDGERWAPLTTPEPKGVRALTTIDGPSGLELYVGGDFDSTTVGPAQGVARLVDRTLVPLGREWTGGVNAIAGFDDGSGEAVFAAGAIEAVGATSLNLVGRWNGSQWTPVAGFFDAPVLALERFDDGTGEALYAGGAFESVAGAAASAVARTDGAGWEALPGLTGVVHAMAVYDDGSGPGLYAAGVLTDIAGAGPGAVARWDGASWSRVAEAGAPAFEGEVLDLAVTELDGRRLLVAGGAFESIGAADALNVAKWDGLGWSPLGPGLPERVTAIAPFLAENPPLAAAHVVTVGGLKTARVMAWNGSAWTSLARVDWTVRAMATTVASDGRTLVYCGGGAVERGSIPVPMLHRLSCVACEADLDFDGELTLFDFILFSDLFARGDLRADLDGDGVLTIKDFLTFQGFFDFGCG